MLKAIAVRFSIVALLSLTSISAFALADEAKRAVNIPAGELSIALDLLARQSRSELMYRPEQVRGFRTRGAQGDLTPREAVMLLLKGTPLEVRTEASGALLVVAPARAATSEQANPEGTQEPSKEGAGKKSSQDFRVAQVDQATAGSQVNESENGKEQKKPVLEEIVVTGSRLARTTTDSAQQVKVYSQQQIQQSGQTTIADFFNTLPEVSTSIGENGFQSIAGGTTVKLHGLPLGTTLVLINGRRIETSPSQQAFGVFFDLNNIPLAAVDRIEVVPEGSSAVYGSDAIAGVVNIVLKSQFDGFEADAKYGHATGTGEADASALWGKHSDAGSIQLIASYQQRDRLQGFDRSSVIRGADPNNEAPGDVGGFVRYTCSPGNVYFPSGYSFNGGPPVSYAAVPTGFTGTPTVQEFAGTAGKLNDCSNHSYVAYADFIPASDRVGALLSGRYGLGSSAELFTEVMFSYDRQSQNFTPSLSLFGEPGSAFFTVPANNPFNPFGQTVGVSTVFPDAGLLHLQLNTTFLRYLAGARGDFLDSWHWEVAGWQSADRTHFEQSGVGNFAAIFGALASSSPQAALNPFNDGPGGNTQLLQSLVLPPIFHDYLGQTRAANAFVRGPLFQLFSGPVEAVLGAEYNADALETDATRFARDYYAAFAEVRVPVVGRMRTSGESDVLSVTAAGRYDRYDDFGSKTTPQFGVELRPIKGLLIRGAYSNAFKAPSLYALDAPIITTPNFLVRDPAHGNQFVDITELSGGNPLLKPETGISRSFGVVYANTALAGLRLSITNWNVDEANSVQNLDAQTIVDNAALFPGAVLRDAAGNLTTVNAGYVNYGRIDVRGIDYEASLDFSTEVGRLTPTLSATQTYHYVTALTPGSPPQNRAGQAGLDNGTDTNFAPRWKGIVGLSWTWGSITASADGRYVGRYGDYGTGREIGNFWLFDGNVRVDFSHVFATGGSWLHGTYAVVGAVNLLNRLPQNSDYEFGEVGYDPTQGDLRGRFVYAQVGVRR